MRMESAALQFSPQIAALAMPGDSGYKAAAEGIGNIGKIFQEQEDREQAAQLNALKMEEAAEGLKAKRFENSIANEKWDQTKNTYALDRRNKQLEALKRESEWKADVKKQTDSGFMEQFKKLVPSQTFVDPQSGKFSEELYQAKRREFAGSGGWAAENVHLFDALADGYRKETLETEKTRSEIDAKEATAAKAREETKFIAPKADAEIAHKKSATNLNNVNAAQAPIKTQAYVEQTKTWAKNALVEGDKLKKDRQKIVADDKLRSMVPGWDGYDEASQRFIINQYIDTGTLPKSAKTVTTKEGIFSDDTRTIPIYPAGTLPKAAPKPAANSVPAASAKPAAHPKSAGGSVPVGTIKTNPATGQKARFDGTGWVLVP